MTISRMRPSSCLVVRRERRRPNRSAAATTAPGGAAGRSIAVNVSTLTILPSSVTSKSSTPQSAHRLSGLVGHDDVDFDEIDAGLEGAAVTRLGEHDEEKGSGSHVRMLLPRPSFSLKAEGCEPHPLYFPSMRRAALLVLLASAALAAQPASLRPRPPQRAYRRRHRQPVVSRRPGHQGRHHRPHRPLDHRSRRRARSTSAVSSWRPASSTSTRTRGAASSKCRPPTTTCARE